MNADYREIVCRRNPWIYFWTGTKCFHLVAGELSLKLHKFQVCRRPRYQKNFIWQKFSQDRSKLISKGSFSKDLKIFLLSTNTMYQKTLRKTFDCRVCCVLPWISNVIAMPNWPHFVSLLPLYKTKDTQNVHVTTELQYGSLFRKKFFDKQTDLQTAVETIVVLIGAFGSVLANCTKTLNFDQSCKKSEWLDFKFCRWNTWQSFCWIHAEVNRWSTGVCCSFWRGDCAIFRRTTKKVALRLTLGNFQLVESSSFFRFCLLKNLLNKYVICEYIQIVVDSWHWFLLLVFSFDSTSFSFGKKFSIKIVTREIFLLKEPIGWDGDRTKMRQSCSWRTVV